MQRQTPASSREVILDATASLLDEGGESAAKLAQVAERAHVNIRTVQRHVGGIKDAIHAAHLQRFSASAPATGTQLAEALREADDADAVRHALDEALRLALSPRGVTMRMQRAHVLSLSRNRPELARHVATASQRERQELEDAIRDAQRRKRLPTKIDPVSAAVLTRATLFGLLQRDLMPPLADEAAATTVLRRALHRVLLGREPEGAFNAPHAPHDAAWRSEPYEPPSDPVARSILDVAIRTLDEGGEDALAITRFAPVAQVKPVTIYRWFGDGQGLIQHAQAARFTGVAYQDVSRLASDADLRSRTALARWGSEEIGRIVADTRRPKRLKRIEVLGAAHARPLVCTTAGAAHEALTRETRRVYARWNDAADLGIHPTALAVYNNGFIVGLTCTDVEVEPPSSKEWIDAYRHLLDHLFRLGTAARRAVPADRGERVARAFKVVPDAVPGATSDVPTRNATHAAILETGHEVLRTEGLAALTIIRVADEIGIAASNVAYYYPHRDMLLRALAERLLGSLDAALRTVAASLQPAERDWADRFIETASERLLDPALRHTLRTLTAMANEDAELLGQLHGELDAFPRVALDALELDGEAASSQAFHHALHVLLRHLVGEALIPPGEDDAQDLPKRAARRATAVLAGVLREGYETAKRDARKRPGTGRAAQA